VKSKLDLDRVTDRSTLPFLDTGDGRRKASGERGGVRIELVALLEEVLRASV